MLFRISFSLCDEGLHQPYTTCILEDSAHDIWLGTENSGLIYFNHLTGKVERKWTEKDGLPNDMIYMLLEARCW